MIIVDTTVWVDYLRGTRTPHADWLQFQIFEAGTVDLAVEAVLNYRRLRAAGRTVRKTIDSLIATFCLMDGHSLLHNDHDYDPFEDVLGLKVIHP